MSDANLFDLCEWCEVELAVVGGTSRVCAWRFGDLAAHRALGSDKWEITHLPSGLCFGSLGQFRAADHALPCMIEIARLRNTWRHIDEGDVLAMRDQLAEIYKRHGALPSCPRKALPYNYRTDLNDGGAT